MAVVAEAVALVDVIDRLILVIRADSSLILARVVDCVILSVPCDVICNVIPNGRLVARDRVIINAVDVDDSVCALLSTVRSVSR